MADVDDSRWTTIRRNWTILAQVAAGVTTVVATIVAPPPTPVGTQGIRPFASFVVAVLAGIFLLILRRLGGRVHANWCSGLASTDGRRLFLEHQFSRCSNRDVEWEDHCFRNRITAGNTKSVRSQYTEESG